MKKAPIILTLLCTNLFWSYSLNAMEEQVVLDRSSGKILVLTDMGRAKAESLQKFYDQQSGRGETPHTGFLIPEGYDEDQELSKALLQTSPDSVENSEHDPTPSALDSTSTVVDEDDDPTFVEALTKSAQEYETRQKKIAAIREQHQKERKEREEKRANSPHDMIIKELQEEREKLYSEKSELKAQESQLEESKIQLLRATNVELQSTQLRIDKVTAIDLQLESLKNRIDLINPITDLIHTEILYLIKGGEPREMPWRVQPQSSSAAAQIAEGESSPLLKPTSSTFPAIPSSALPTFNSDSPEKK